MHTELEAMILFWWANLDVGVLKFFLFAVTVAEVPVVVSAFLDVRKQGRGIHFAVL